MSAAKRAPKGKQPAARKSARSRPAKRPAAPENTGPRSAEPGELPIAQLLGMRAQYNPRKISDADFAALRRSIRFFGFVEPVVVNRRLDRIVGGHQRIRAASEEGFERLPVMFVDLDEPSEQQLNVALNRISGEWDDGKLLEVLASIESAGADLALTGFGDRELAKLLGDGAETRGGGERTDATPLEFRVVVDCANERQQVELIEKLEAEGWACKPLIS